MVVFVLLISLGHAKPPGVSVASRGGLGNARPLRVISHRMKYRANTRQLIQ